MNRQEKEKTISVVKELISESQAVLLVNYKGLNVADMQNLRGNLRQSGGRLKVVKTTLMDIATDKMEGFEGFKANLKDQVGFVFVRNDISVVAKQLVNFANKNKALKIISGVFESKTLNSSEIEMIASLPSRDVLLAQVAYGMKAPITSFVRVLNMLVMRLFYVLKQIEKEKEKGSDN